MNTHAPAADRPIASAGAAGGLGDVTISRLDAGWRLRASIWLPKTIDEVFQFFADARNLERITPPFLRFEVMTPAPIEMKVGALIEPGVAFVDEQLKGPYRKWRHTHTFAKADGGVIAGDIVDYNVPGGPLSPIVHALAVKRDVRSIFHYRQCKLQEIFGC